MKKVLFQKSKGTARLIFDFFRLAPKRLGRLFRHFPDGLDRLFRAKKKTEKRLGRSVLFWWIELLFFALDVFGLPEIWEATGDWFKFGTRPLTEREIAFAEKIFAQTIDYQRVRIDERAHAGPRFFHFAYVACSTINVWGRLPDSILIHEMAHVWQFQTVGSVYIPRALRAIHSPEGYDYGGLAAIRKALENGAGLAAFNYEQQADAIADFWRLENGLSPRWSQPNEGTEDFRRIVRAAIFSNEKAAHGAQV